MKFFETDEGWIFPVHRIENIHRGKYSEGATGRGSGRVYLKSDETGIDQVINLSDPAIDALVRASQPVIPAQPDYYLLGYHYSPETDEGVYVEELPIVGWRMDELGLPVPIVTDYDFQGMTSIYAIRWPDGRVIEPIDGLVFADQTLWEKHMRKTLDDAHERAQARRRAEGGSE